MNNSSHIFAIINEHNINNNHPSYTHRNIHRIEKRKANVEIRTLQKKFLFQKIVVIIIIFLIINNLINPTFNCDNHF